MSEDQPTESTAQFETVGPAGAGTGSRRVAVIATVAVAVTVALGGAAFAAYSFLDGGGPQPDEVLPASTVALVSVDLDPSAGQKIAAIKTIRKFPALKDSLGLEADDDLREFIFDKAVEEGDCKGLDFDDDVKPWLGKRAAFAAVDLGGDDPVPAIALEVSDADEAKKGFDALVKCTDPDDFAYVVGEDYLIGSDTAENAKAILDKGEQKALADDAAYQKWTGETGEAGVLNFYVASRAADYAVDFLDDMGSNLLGFGGGGLPGEGDDATTDDPLDPAREALEDFKGLAGTVRFAGGGMELSLAGGGITQFTDMATVGAQLGDLPADTAVAFGFGVSEDYADKLIDDMVSSDDTIAEIEQDTGLDLPKDLQTLLGRAITLSLGGDAPESLDEVDSVEEVPAGLVIHGDADEIQAVIAKVEDHLGMHLADIPIVIDGSGDKVALATSSAYADELLKSGKLASDDGYRSAVPNADKSAGILYIDFDSPWRDSLVDMVRAEEGEDAGTEADENTEPLRALGLSSWEDGDVSHALLKIATD